MIVNIHGEILPDSIGQPTLKNTSRWLDKNRLQVDLIEDGVRETYKRNPNGFRLIEVDEL